MEKEIRNVKPCPFRAVEKEMGHEQYTIKIDGLWFMQCSCGARGPMSPTENYSVTTWNTRSKEQ